MNKKPEEQQTTGQTIPAINELTNSGPAQQVPEQNEYEIQPVPKPEPQLDPKIAVSQNL